MPDLAEVPPGLATWAGLPGPAAVLGEVRRRARRGHATESGSLRLELPPDHRRQVARLVGTRWDVSGRPLRLQDVAAALAEHGLTVREFVERVDGMAIVADRTIRAADDARREDERSAAAAVLRRAGVDPAHAGVWLDDAVLPRPGTGELLALCRDVAVVRQHVAAVGGRAVPLAALAASLFGDAHALDHSRLLGRASARLLAVCHGLARPTRAGREWRAVWAAAGVRCDGVSSRVLVLNLPLTGDGVAARWSAAGPGEPQWLTLRSVAGPWSLASRRRVFVCENVTVVEAAADELGPACPPMVCTDGIPSNAALDLVGRLAAEGCPVAVRADVDEAGLVVVDQVRRVAPSAECWRYDVPTYLRYAGPLDLPVSTVGRGDQDLAALAGAYAAAGRALHEEELLDDLLADLAAAAARGHS